MKSSSPKYVIGLKYECEISYHTTKQLTTKDEEIIRQNLSKLLRRKNTVVRYDCLPIRGTHYLTSALLGIATVSGVALVLTPVRSLSALSRLWSKHEMHAAELSDEVESKVQPNAVCDCDGLLATN